MIKSYQVSLSSFCEVLSSGASIRIRKMVILYCPIQYYDLNIINIDLETQFCTRPMRCYVDSKTDERRRDDSSLSVSTGAGDGDV